MVTSNLICSLLGITRNLLVARGLGPDDFGVYALLILFVSYFGLFDLGVNNGGLYILSRTPNNIRLKNMFRGAVLASLFYGVLLGWCAYKLLPVNDVYGFILALLPLTVISNYITVEIRVAEQFKHFARSNVIATFVSLVIILWAEIFSVISINLALISVLLVPLFSIMYILFFLNRLFKFDIKLSIKSIILFVSRGFIVTAVPALALIYAGLDRFLLSDKINPDIFGAFAFGCSLGTLGLIIPNSINVVIFKRFFGDLKLRQWYYVNGLNFLIMLIGTISYFMISELVIWTYFKEFAEHMIYIHFGVISILVLSISHIPINFALVNFAKLTLKIGVCLLIFKFMIVSYFSDILNTNEILKLVILVNLIYVFTVSTTGHYLYHLKLKSKDSRI